MNNILYKADRFCGFLKSKYPVLLPLTIRLCKTYPDPDPDFTGVCILTKNNEIKIHVKYGKQSHKNVLFTLAHEYAHALQYDRYEVFNRNKDGVDWQKEIEANLFAEKVTQEYKKFIRR